VEAKMKELNRKEKLKFFLNFLWFLLAPNHWAKYHQDVKEEDLGVVD
jgi:hypothetical protein